MINFKVDPYILRMKNFDQQIDSLQGQIDPHTDYIDNYRQQQTSEANNLRLNQEIKYLQSMRQKELMHIKSFDYRVDIVEQGQRLSLGKLFTGETIADGLFTATEYFETESNRFIEGLPEVIDFYLVELIKGYTTGRQKYVDLVNKTVKDCNFKGVK